MEKLLFPEVNTIYDPNWIAPEHKPTTLAPIQLLESSFDLNCPEFNRIYTQTLKNLTGILGKPFFAENGFILFNRDCLSSLQKLKTIGVKFNLTLTSPPYNIGKEYEENRSLEGYIDWCEEWIEAIYDTATSDGSFWLNLGYLAIPTVGKAVPIAYLLWNKSDFFLHQEIVWHYGAGVSSKKSFSPRNEKWLYYVKDENKYAFNLDAVRDPDVKYPNQKKHGKFRCNPLGKNPSDVWIIPKVTSGDKRSSKERTDHPAQFPLKLVDRIVKVSSDPLNLILDPFCGSGSAGIAAVGNGRIFVGFEIRKDYCEMTAERFHDFLTEKQSIFS